MRISIGSFQRILRIQILICGNDIRKIKYNDNQCTILMTGFMKTQGLSVHEHVRAMHCISTSKIYEQQKKIISSKIWNFVIWKY